ncbi:MAG: hypothetical protein ACFFG0_02925 [Candidatus Thorarchaeota archaeon]
MSIKISNTKGYIGKIEIEIYHNNKKIDFESIQEAFNEDCARLQNHEEEYLKEI